MDSVVFTIIGASVVLVVAILNWATSNRETVRWDKRAYQYAVLLAAAFTAFGTWRGFLLSEEKTWQQAEVQFRNDWLQQKQLKERVQYERELRSKANELAQKSDEITALNRTIANAVTGGDSFIFLSFTVELNSNNASINLVHRGKYPVFDVSIELWDSDEFDDRLRKMGLKDYEGPVTREQMIALTQRKATFSIPTVRPNMAMGVMDRWQLPSDKNLVRYQVAIYTRNGIFSQSLNLQRVNGSWIQASQVFSNTNSKKGRILLNEWTHPDFPRNKQGKVVW